MSLLKDSVRLIGRRDPCLAATMCRKFYWHALNLWPEVRVDEWVRVRVRVWVWAGACVLMPVLFQCHRIPSPCLNA